MDATLVRSMGTELKQFVAEFDDCFGRSEPREHLRAYVNGQLSDLPRKSVEPIAEEAYGRGADFLDGMDGLGQNYVGEIPSDFYGWTLPPRVLSAPHRQELRKKGRKNRQRICAWPWNRCEWRRRPGWKRSRCIPPPAEASTTAWPRRSPTTSNTTSRPVSSTRKPQ